MRKQGTKKKAEKKLLKRVRVLLSEPAVNLTVRIQESLLKRIRAVSERQERSIASYVRRALRHALDAGL